MSSRDYEMRARAESVTATRWRILRSVLDLATERLTVEVTLDDVAARAGVSVRTVLRHFGDRERLLDAAFEAAAADIIAERLAPADDPTRAIAVLVDHYERRGDLVLRLLAQEENPRIGPAMATGRLVHREWVVNVFGTALPGGMQEQEAVIDLLVVATDVYAWKLLRRDRGLGRVVVEARILALTAAVLADAREGKSE
ncbi:TetR/AcrR family transcriptional regulator [Leifsonia bigeumensis]|uniref:TetR/AcrR family transcriptional regulator n=1 Tax=Leifsonella bigeumensis TaxID=433643 RepID=A0ABP7FH67_9MICO